MATGDPSCFPYRHDDCGRIEPNPEYFGGAVQRMGYWARTSNASNRLELDGGGWQWVEPEPSRTAIPEIFPLEYPFEYPMIVPMPQSIPQGWECPRCHRINAPSVTQCPCRPRAKGE